MKKTIKMLCLALALVMLFAACGQGTTSSTPTSSKPQESTPASSTASESSPASTASTAETGGGYAYEQNTDPVTLSIFVDSPGTLWENWGSDPVSKKITEITGISFECIAPVTDDDTKLQLLISSDELPDIVTSWYGYPTWDSMVQMGQLADLEALAEQYAPKYFTELIDPALADFCRLDDGTVRYLVSCWNTPEYVEWMTDHNWLITTNQPVVLIRQDYYEECGSPEVGTPEDFYDLCLQIKEKHPDTIPFYTGGNTQNGPSYLRWLFGPCSYYKNPDTGEISGSYRDPRYLQMYKWVNKMVNAGLMGEESFVDGETEKDAKSLAGEVATYMWTVGETGKVPADNPNTQYYPMKPWNTYEAVRSNAGYIRWAISEKSEKKEAAMRFLEFGSSDLGAETMYWGIEGEPGAEFSGDVVNGPHFYREEDGKWGEKITYYEGFQAARNADWSGTEKASGLGFYGSYVNGNVLNGATAECMPTPLMQEMNEWYAPTVVFDDALVFSIPAGSDEYVINQQISTLIGEYNVQWAFAKDEAEVETLYNEFLSKVEALGEQKLIDWYTKTYAEQGGGK